MTTKITISEDFRDELAKTLEENKGKEVLIYDLIAFNIVLPFQFVGVSHDKYYQFYFIGPDGFSYHFTIIYKEGEHEQEKIITCHGETTSNPVSQDHENFKQIIVAKNEPNDVWFAMELIIIKDLNKWTTASMESLISLRQRIESRSPDEVKELLETITPPSYSTERSIDSLLSILSTELPPSRYENQLTTVKINILDDSLDGEKDYKVTVANVESRVNHKTLSMENLPTAFEPFEFGSICEEHFPGTNNIIETFNRKARTVTVTARNILSYTSWPAHSGNHNVEGGKASSYFTGVGKNDRIDPRNLVVLKPGEKTNPNVVIDRKKISKITNDIIEKKITKTVNRYEKMTVRKTGAMGDSEDGSSRHVQIVELEEPRMSSNPKSSEKISPIVVSPPWASEEDTKIMPPKISDQISSPKSDNPSNDSKTNSSITMTDDDVKSDGCSITDDPDCSNTNSSVADDDSFSDVKNEFKTIGIGK